jgi:hypothetical protein
MNPKPSRTPSILSASLNSRLNAYALAASAAGVTVLALSQPAETKIIYTKTHKVIGWNGVCSLDLNHDGVVDFLIREASSDYQPLNGLFAKEAYGNAVRGYRGIETWSNFVSVLKRGSWIGIPRGPRQNFVHGGYLGEGMVSFFITDNGPGTNGGWRNVTNRYLGLKFQIDGATHYGWARLNVRLKRPYITATLTGYAYETIPNKGINAGQTDSNPDPPDFSTDSVGPTLPAPSSSSLGMLAAGAQSASAGGWK